MEDFTDIDILQCPSTGKNLSLGSGSLDTDEQSFKFQDGYYSFINQEEELAKQDRYIQRVYDAFSKIYDAAMPMLFPFLGLKEQDVRKEIIQYLELNKVSSILEVSIGTGANIPLLLQCKSNLKICGIDLSSGMLKACVSNLRKWGLTRISLYQTSASKLPFKDNQFDAILHVGGINSFANKEAALLEMLRVVKPGGKIVINDEGLSPKRNQEWYSRIFIKSMFSLFASLERGEMDPPEYILPAKGIENYRLDYVGNGYFWVMSFNKAIQRVAI
jgi:ubiquinone/menaquinone biosynthesis C-methylase UbiE